MRAKTILAFLFLVSLAAAAYVLVNINRASQGVQHVAEAAAAPQPPRTVVVAAAGLPAGTLLRAQDVKWESRPVSADVPGQIQLPSEISGKADPVADEAAMTELFGAVLREPVGEGKPIPKTIVAKPGDRGFLPAVLMSGNRALTISVPLVGLIFPGDRVDVILTQSFRGNDAPLTRRSVGETVVEDIRVLAMDQKVDADIAGSDRRTRNVTLELTPAQVEKINVAAELGKLTLALRGQVGAAPPPEPQSATWAEDVSPALRERFAPRPAPPTPPQVSAARPPAPIKVIRGSNIENVPQR